MHKFAACSYILLEELWDRRNQHHCKLSYCISLMSLSTPDACRYVFLEELWERRKGVRATSSIEFALIEQAGDPKGVLSEAIKQSSTAQTAGMANMHSSHLQANEHHSANYSAKPQQHFGLECV